MATPLTPDAPDNPMTQGVDHMVAPPSNGMMQGPMGAPPNAMMGAPAPQGPPPTPPDPKAIEKARKHIDIMLSGLTKLAAMPKGTLTKKDVFSEAADVISKGCYDTPQDKQQLIAGLAALPDNESDIRKAIGAQIMQLAQAHEMIMRAFGPPVSQAPPANPTPQVEPEPAMGGQ